MTARHDETGGAEHGGRAQDGADVVRIGDLIEHDERPCLGALGEFLNVGLFERLGFEHDALVHGVLAEQAVEIARGDALGCQLSRGDGFGEAVFGVLGHQQPQHLAGVVAQCGFHCVNTIELHAALIESAGAPAVVGVAGADRGGRRGHSAAAGRGVGSGMSVSWDRGSVQAGASCRFSI